MRKRWKLSDETAEELLQLPETGMGFQFVEGVSNSRRLQLLVLNADFAYDVTDLQLSDASDPATILLNGTRLIEGMQSAQITDDVLRLSSVTVTPPRVTGGGGPPLPPSGGPSATVAPPSGLVKSYALISGRMFYRFSAYNPDKRVNANGDFSAGTYATTDSDHPLVTSGFAAVGRYALPNVLSAFYRYQLSAPAGTPVTTGTVAPAFGQSGGGVEALFTTAVINAQSPPVVTQLPED